jgi:hypothetical protein
MFIHIKQGMSISQVSEMSKTEAAASNRDEKKLCRLLDGRTTDIRSKEKKKRSWFNFPFLPHEMMMLLVGENEGENIRRNFNNFADGLFVLLISHSYNSS